MNWDRVRKIVINGLSLITLVSFYVVFFLLSLKTYPTLKQELLSWIILGLLFCWLIDRFATKFRHAFLMSNKIDINNKYKQPYFDQIVNIVLSLVSVSIFIYLFCFIIYPLIVNTLHKTVGINSQSTTVLLTVSIYVLVRLFIYPYFRRFIIFKRREFSSYELAQDAIILGFKAKAHKITGDWYYITLPVCEIEGITVFHSFYDAKYFFKNKCQGKLLESAKQEMLYLKGVGNLPAIHIDFPTKNSIHIKGPHIFYFLSFSNEVDDLVEKFKGLGKVLV